MRLKSGSVFVISCLFTWLNQIVYHYEVASDSLRYINLAKQYTDLNFFDPYTNCYGHPLYALFLALVGSLISYHPFVIGLAQTIVFCLAVLCLVRELGYYLKRDLWPLSLIVIFVPEIQLFNGYLLTESLAYSLILFSFYFALKLLNQGANKTNLFYLSLSLALAILNRLECAVILIPILYLVYPSIKEKLVMSMLIILSLPLLLVQLNGYRNYRTFHTYQWSAFNGGEVLYGGNNRQLDGSHHTFWEHKNIYIPQNKQEELNQILAEPECDACPKRDAFFLHLAVDAWKENASTQIGVIPDKLAKNWLLPGNFDIYTSDTTGTKGLQISRLLSKENFNNVWYAPYKHFAYMLVHWIILILIGIGIFKSKRQNRFQLAVLLVLAFYLLFAIPFCGLPRWHVTVLPLLVVTFTPLGLLEWLTTIMSHMLRRSKAD